MNELPSDVMRASAKIEYGISYKFTMGKKLKVVKFDDFKSNMPSSFILKKNDDEIAVSRWVSAKRTRSYPYASVYDTMGFSGKKVTIIPIIKDEGSKGDRDFLNWSTIALMSLLGVHVIIAYYIDAEKHPKIEGKVTNQRFDIEHIKRELDELSNYRSDALHWNLSRITDDKLKYLVDKSLSSYGAISEKLGIKMHSLEDVKRIYDLKRGRESFIKTSLEYSKKAQKRETLTLQPKENIEGDKCAIVITNYLGGEYDFTCDEIEIHENYACLIEAKNTKKGKLPSRNDIKDGFLKMVLFTNLKKIDVSGKQYDVIPILKLTTKGVDLESLTSGQKTLFESVKREAKDNGIKLLIDGKYLELENN